MLFKKKLSHGNNNDDDESFEGKLDKIMAWILLVAFIPLMFILTGNTVYNLGL